ncbi:MAG: glycosyltransferase family 1 protein [Actinomycetota bacterium]|nr:glycosyltransferase family 1 protein [Actinomycetota bacterium]
MRETHVEGRPRLRVAYEATALLGFRTGVGEFCYGALNALARIESLDVNAFAISHRRRHMLKQELPAGVGFSDWIMPARPLHAMWNRYNFPPLELWDRRVDVVHGTNFVVPPTYSAGKVVTVHDLTTLRFPEMCDAATLVFPKMVQQAIDGGAFVHTPSYFVAQEVMENFRVDPAKVVAIHHGIPLLDPSVDLDAAQVGPLVGRRFVLALGTVEPRKDYPMLVRAFDEVVQHEPDLILVIAGKDGWGSSDLTSVITSVKSRSKIFRLGYVTPATRQWLLKNATVFAYPSIYEGFGFPPLEAMSLGTPVVSTTSGALAEVLSDACALLVKSGDMNGLATGLMRLVGDESERARLSQAGLEHVNRFSWDLCASELASLYQLAGRK